MSTAGSSAASSPPQQAAAAARSSRVCLNCRRKKKRCDKALPSCGRCTYSLQVCQHEDDIPSGANASGPIHFEAFMGHVVAPVRTYAPVMELLLPPQPGPRWSLLNPALFASIDTTEDVHSFAFRCLSDILGHRQAIEHVAASYFNGINTWFTVIERTSFDASLEGIWTKPSAEASILVLCMRLIIRSPVSDSVAGMGDSLYLSAKTLLNLVQSKMALSIPLLQAELLVALYEYSHSMPQQAYMTIGRCFHITKAFGWHYEPFWRDERQALVPRELKLCSILWWAVVYIDCLIHVSYQDQKYPMHTANLHWDFSIPFPESFDQYLPGSVFGSQAPGSGTDFLDANTEHIDGIVWPEATSAWYLSNVLQQLSSPTAPNPTDRNLISGAITAHTINMLSSNWKRGDRSVAVGTNFIALMKINQPGLLSGTTTRLGGSRATTPSGEADQRAAETIRSVINSIYTSVLNSEQSEQGLRDCGVAASGAFAMYYASLLLVSHGAGVLKDAEWLQKVEAFKIALARYTGRWKVAERYVESVSIALSTQLGTLQIP